eukprot:568376-Hanusia_phi.AAC.1
MRLLSAPVLSVLLLTLPREISTNEEFSQPLIGASLNWKFDPAPGNRSVYFDLQIAMGKSRYCTYQKGKAVICTGLEDSIACSNPLCQVAQVHGILCVGQVVSSHNGLFFKYSAADGCPSDLDMSDISTVGRVGKVNDFQVESLIDIVETCTEFDNSSSGIVTGNLKHRVSIDDDTIAVVAWLYTGKNYYQKTRNGKETGQTFGSLVCYLADAFPSLLINGSSLNDSSTYAYIPVCDFSLQNSWSPSVPLYRFMPSDITSQLFFSYRMSCFQPTFVDYGCESAATRCPDIFGNIANTFHLNNNSEAQCSFSTCSEMLNQSLFFPPFTFYSYTQYSCLNFSSNNAPQISTSGKSLDSFFICTVGQPCEIPLNVTCPLDGCVLTSDENFDGPMQNEIVELGRQTSGSFIRLMYIYRIQYPKDTKGLANTTSMFSRCLVARRLNCSLADIRSCESHPKCVTIRLQHRASIYNFDSELPTPHASISACLGQDVLALELNLNSSFLDSYHLEVSGGSSVCFERIMPYLFRTHANSICISFELLLEFSQFRNPYRFRISTESETGLWHGGDSNEISIFPSLPCHEGAVLAVTWHSQKLRVYASMPNGNFDELFSLVTGSPQLGAITIDDRESSLYSLVPRQNNVEESVLVKIDLRDSPSVAISPLVFSNFSVWNLEYNEAYDNFVAVKVFGSEFTIFTFSFTSADIKDLLKLDRPIQFGISCFCVKYQLYFLIDALDSSVVEIDLQGISKRHYAPYQRSRRLISISYSADQKTLYGVSSGWPQDLHLSFVNFMDEAWQVTNTTLLDSFLHDSVTVMDLECFKWYRANVSEGISLSVYDMHSWKLLQSISFKDLVGDLLYIFPQKDLKPSIRAMLLPSITTDLQMITIAGKHFGFRDFSPLVKVDDILCERTSWYRDDMLACVLPPFFQRNNENEYEFKIMIQDKSSSSDFTPLYLEYWIGILPSSSPVFVGSSLVTISGFGFRAPFSQYTCAFSTFHHVALSSEIVEGQENKLVFKLPYWSSAAGRTDVDLFRSNKHQLNNYAVSLIQSNSTTSFYMIETWKGILPSAEILPAYGNVLVTVLGEGFDVDANYTCTLDFRLTSFSAIAITSNHTTAICNFSYRLLDSGFANFSFLRSNQPVLFWQADDYLLKEHSIPITFREVWTSFSPLSVFGVQNHEFTVSGSGFRQAYSCIFHSLQGGDQMRCNAIVNDLGDSLSCCNSQDLSVNASGQYLISILSVPGNFPVIKHGLGAKLQFYEIVESFEPTEIEIDGIISIDVRGFCFQPGKYYEISVWAQMYNSENFNVSESSYRSSSFSFVSPRQLLFQVDTSLFVASVANISLFSNINGQRTAIFANPGMMIYFKERVITPFLKEVYATESTLIAFQTSGFNSARSYMCRFSQNHSNDVIYQSTVTVLNASYVECFVNIMTAGNFYVEIIRADNVLIRSGFDIRVLEYWIKLTPSFSSAGGGIVTIFGKGFDPTTRTYRCGFAQGSIIDNSSIAFQYGSTSLTCAFPNSFLSGFLRVTISAQDSSGNIYPIELRYTSAEYIRLIEEIDQIVPTQFSARGGTNLTITGHGFLQTENYFFYFGKIRVTKDCMRYNQSYMVCETIQYNYSSGIDFFYLMNHEPGHNITLRSVEIFSEIDSIVPLTASAYRGTALTVSGFGFDPSKRYVIILGLADLRNMSFAATANSQNEIFSNLEKWTFEAGEASIAILENNNPVVLASSLNSFHIFPEIISVQPNQYAAGLQQQLTVYGAGFDPGRNSSTYRCLTSAGTSSNLVFALSYTSIVCNLSEWNLEARSSSFYVQDSLLHLNVTGSLAINFTESVYGVQPNESFAQNGIYITMFGAGFNKASKYSLDFHGFNTQDRLEVTNITRIDEKYIVFFISSSWNFAGGFVNVSLINSGFLVPNSQLFRLKPVINFLEPTTGYVFGSVVQVSGFGFLLNEKIYTFRVTAGSNSSWNIQSESVEASSPQVLAFQIPEWKWALDGNGTFTFSVFESNSKILVIDHPVNFEIKLGWIGITHQPQLSFNGGDSITVFGGGFSSKSQFFCRFTPSDIGGSNIYKEEPALVLNLRELLCQTPSWIFASSYATFSLWYLISGNKREVNQLLYPVGSTKVFFEGYPSLLGGNLNGPIRGQHKVTLDGNNFGMVDLTPKVRVGDTSCEFTAWLSSTQLICGIPSKHGVEVIADVIISIGPYRVGSRSKAFTFDGPSVSDIHVMKVNATQKTSEWFTIMGMNFLLYDSSPAARTGGTACETTVWYSTSSMSSKNAAGNQDHLPVHMTVDYSSSVSTLSLSFSFDHPEISSAGVFANALQAGSISLSLWGSDFGIAQMSISARNGGTNSESTRWHSYTSVTIRTVRSGMKTKSAQITLGQSRFSTMTELFTSDGLILSSTKVKNSAYGQLVQLVLEGFSFSPFESTGRSSIGSSTTKSTTWLSTTSVQAFSIAGISHTKKVIFSVSGNVRSLTEAYSFATPAVSLVYSKIDAGAWTEIPVSWNFVEQDFHVFYRINQVIQRQLFTVDWLIHDNSLATVNAPSNWNFIDVQGVAELQTLPGFQDIVRGSIITQTNPIYGSYDKQEVEGTTLAYVSSRSYSSTRSRWQDFTLEVVLVNLDENWIGVSFRYVDDQNYYRWEMNSQNNVLRLKKRKHGVLEVLYENSQTKIYDRNIVYRISIRVIEGVVEVYMDEFFKAPAFPTLGTLLVRKEDADLSLPSEGTIGLWSAGSRLSCFLSVGIYRPLQVARMGNLVANGDGEMTVHGTNFGQFASVKYRIRQTETEASKWISGSMMIVGSVSEMVSYNLPSLSVSVRSNTASTGSQRLTVFGSNIAETFFSQQIRKAGTASEATKWLTSFEIPCRGCFAEKWASDTSIHGYSSSGIGGSLRLIVSVGMISGTETEIGSFDPPSLSVSKRTNVCSTGSSFVTIMGQNFANNQHTSRVRIASDGGTSTENTKWISDTTLRAKPNQIYIQTAKAIITLHSTTGTNTQMFSTNLPGISSSLTNKPSTGSIS